MKNKTTNANISHRFPCGILSAILLCALLNVNIPTSFSKENYLPNGSTLIAQNVLQGTVQMSDQADKQDKKSPNMLMQFAKHNDAKVPQASSPLKGKVEQSDKKDDNILLQFAKHNDAKVPQASSPLKGKVEQSDKKDDNILLQFAKHNDAKVPQASSPLKGKVEQSDKKDDNILLQFAKHNDAKVPSKEEAKDIDTPKLASANGESATYLTGSIKHSDKMSPLSNLLKAGVTFSEQNLPKLTGGTGWYWIPAWFAGTYKTHSSTTYFAKDIKSGYAVALNERRTSISKETIGFQKDGKGNLWEYEYGPYRQQVLGDNDLTVQQIQEHEPLEITGNKVVIRYKSINVTIDRATNIIQKTEQVESIQVYTKHSNDTIKCQSSLKAFDTDGTPIILQKLYSIKTRIQPYSEIVRYKDKDMRKDFVNYLVGKKRLDLLPAYSKDYIEPEDELTAKALFVPAKNHSPTGSLQTIRANIEATKSSIANSHLKTTSKSQPRMPKHTKLNNPKQVKSRIKK